MVQYFSLFVISIRSDIIVKFVLKSEVVPRFGTPPALYLRHESDKRRIQREAGFAVCTVYQGGVPVACWRLPTMPAGVPRSWGNRIPSPPSNTPVPTARVKQRSLRTLLSMTSRARIRLQDGVISLGWNELFTLLKEKVAIAQESRCLAELRDTLLPRLMSGELHVNDM